MLNGMNKQQAVQRDFSGRLIYRWRVVLPGGRTVYSWAATKADAEQKCIALRHVCPLSITPAEALHV